MSIFKRLSIKHVVLLLVLVTALYGAGRLYYRVTGGFTISNISSEFPNDERWAIAPFSPTAQASVDSIMDQKFTYLGKGCQSYVFLSEDGNYVLKFFKYQRFRLQPWLNYLTFLPGMTDYRNGKIEKKRAKVEGVFSSWKIAFENLQPETGLVFVHLNKSSNLNKTLRIFDKMGFEHLLDADQFEFLIQRKADMLCAYIDDLMAKGQTEESKQLISNILTLVVSEYQRGYADNDHALMQNTGVMDGKPVHIDVGQFVKDDSVKDPAFYKQELFSKTYKFRYWLEEQHPQLAKYLEAELRLIIGNNFSTMIPHFKQHE
ncbi:MAG: hypothetical protein H0X51_03740 [Parachlamydiaceae bacterium]|nr:hypothetical protein [Parachlamydiaceae bacterium]